MHAAIPGADPHQAQWECVFRPFKPQSVAMLSDDGKGAQTLYRPEKAVNGQFTLNLVFVRQGLRCL